ncbi:MAG: ATP-binding protein [Planctomycetota bacterium]
MTNLGAKGWLRWGQGPSSLRLRILAWYSLIVMLSLLLISALVMWEASRSLWMDVDNDLLAGAKLIDGAIRRLPPEVLGTFSPDAGLRGEPIHRPPRPGGPRGDRGQRSGRPRPFNPRNEGPLPGGGVDGAMGTPRSNAWFQPSLDTQEVGDNTSTDNLASPRETFEESVDWSLLERIAPIRLSLQDAQAYSLVWGSDGSLLHQSRLPEEFPMVEVGEWTKTSFAGRSDRVVRQMRGHFRELFFKGPNESVICVGMNTTRELDRLWRYSMFLLLSGLSVFGIALLGGNWCLRRTLEPMRKMQAASEAIGTAQLDQRFDVRAMDREVADVASAINTMLDRLQQGFEQQKQFTADASHELRTPLAILLSSTELALSRERSAESYKKELEKCNRAAHRMHGLVESLLTLSRLEAPFDSGSMPPLRFDTICRDQLEYLAELAQHRNVTLRSEIDSCTVHGDAVMLERLVSNLLVNAIHYNQPGGWVQLTLRMCEPTPGQINPLVRLTVQDSGIGIPKDELPNLFKRFYRVDKARSRSSEGLNGSCGSGLGLAICDAIVKCHGGRIDAESVESAGSTFTVELPTSTAK